MSKKLNEKQIPEVQNPGVANLPAITSPNLDALPTLDELNANVPSPDELDAMNRESANRVFELVDTLQAADYKSASPAFAAKLAALPADLTGYNLQPLYDLAETVGERLALEKLERVWQPDAANLGARYNGPKGENGQPMRSNVSKWENLDWERHRKQYEAPHATSRFATNDTRIARRAAALLEADSKADGQMSRSEALRQATAEIEGAENKENASPGVSPGVKLPASIADYMGIQGGDTLIRLEPGRAAWFRDLEPGQTVEPGKLCLSALEFPDQTEAETFTGPWPGAEFVAVVESFGATFRPVAVAVCIVERSPR